MEKIKSFFASKSYGFYVTLCLIVLSIITASLYAVNYKDFVAYMDWTAVILILVAVCLSIAMIVFKLGKFAPAVLAVGNFAGLLIYIQKIYGYVAVVMVGIDVNTFSAQFLICTTFFALTSIISLVNVYLKQDKVNKVEEK